MPPLRILLADDHAPTRAGVREMLEAHGMEVLREAADAADVMAAADAHEHVDVALIEPRLPGGGIAAAAHLIRTGAARRVVMLAGGELDEETLFAALDAGVSGYLLKDIDPDRIAFAVQGVVDGEGALPRVLLPTVLDEFRRRGRSGRPPSLAGAERLSEREWQILELLAEGLATREVAGRVGISEVTVRRHISAAVAKLGVSDRATAVALVRADAETGGSR
jgi:two-component system NarL family response regulator